MKKIESLTPEQEAMLSVYRDKWIEIGWNSDPVDMDKVKHYAALAYKEGGVKFPTDVRFASSPIEAADIWEKETGERPSGSDFGYGNHDADWLSFYDFVLNELKLDCCKPLIPLMELAKVCGWWIGSETLFIACAKTEAKYTIEAGRRVLHCEGGPALVIGTKTLFYLYGTEVPEWLAVTDIQKLSVADVLKIQNTEVRTVGIRRLGVDRLLEKGTVVNTATVPNAYTYEADNQEEVTVLSTLTYMLYDLGKVLGVEKALYLKMQNPSVPGLYHCEGVENDCETVQDALNFRVYGNKNGGVWTPSIQT